MNDDDTSCCCCCPNTLRYNDDDDGSCTSMNMNKYFMIHINNTNGIVVCIILPIDTILWSLLSGVDVVDDVIVEIFRLLIFKDFDVIDSDVSDVFAIVM